MTEAIGGRAVALLLCGAPAVGGCPPGVSAAAFVRALAEDVADLIAELPGLAAAVAYTPEHAAVAEAVRWPGTELVALPAGAGARAALDRLGELGYVAAAVIAPDTPDLPGLLIAKVFAGLASADAAAVPALPPGRLDLPTLARGPAGGESSSGGLAALGCRLPAPEWLDAHLADLDRPDAVVRLRAAAPRRALVVTPAWRRLRTPADVGGLDPDLEGWEATRALLSSGVVS
jgi:hypothetical protein